MSLYQSLKSRRRPTCRQGTITTTSLSITRQPIPIVVHKDISYSTIQPLTNKTVALFVSIEPVHVETVLLARCAQLHHAADTFTVGNTKLSWTDSSNA